MKETKFKQTEVGMIPSDWDVAVLGKITTHVDYRGKTPKKKPLGIQLITAKNIRMGYIDYKSNQEFVSEDDYLDVMKRGLPQKGDVLITTEAPCGYVAQIDNEKIALAQRVIKYRGNNGLINDYLSRYFQSELFQNILASLNTGGTVQGIKGSVLHTLPVVLPKSTEEQQRIANALSDVDTLIANLEKLIVKKKNIKQGAMQQLLTGKKRLPGFAPAKPTYKQTELGKIPSDWEVKKLLQLCDKFLDGDWIEADDQSEDGFRLIQTGNVGNGRYLDKANRKHFISESTFKRLNCTEIFAGDVLVSRLPDPVGRACILPESSERRITAVDCTIIHFANYNPILFVNYTQTKVYQNAVNECLSGSTRLRISRKNLGDMLVPVPSSKEEQTAIANVLSDMDTEIATLETKLAKYRKLKTGMMQQLLTGKIRLV